MVTSFEPLNSALAAPVNFRMPGVLASKSYSDFTHIVPAYVPPADAVYDSLVLGSQNPLSFVIWKIYLVLPSPGNCTRYNGMIVSTTLIAQVVGTPFSFSCNCAGVMSNVSPSVDVATMSYILSNFFLSAADIRPFALAVATVVSALLSNAVLSALLSSAALTALFWTEFVLDASSAASTMVLFAPNSIPSSLLLSDADIRPSAFAVATVL